VIKPNALTAEPSSETAKHNEENLRAVGWSNLSTVKAKDS
jgi:hypothetical protein